MQLHLSTKYRFTQSGTIAQAPDVECGGVIVCRGYSICKEEGANLLRHVVVLLSSNASYFEKLFVFGLCVRKLKQKSFQQYIELPSNRNS